MRRLFDDKLLAWKTSAKRKPLIVHGARQVGKTWSIDRFGALEFEETVKIDFEKRPDILPLFKAVLLDVGLLQRLGGLPADCEMQHRDLLDIYRGQLAEQFVAQELLVTQARELFYWSREARGSQAEVDFLAVQEGRIHPVEVKSGAGGQLRSLHLALQTYPDCGEGLVLYSGPYGERPEQRLRFIPLYYAGTIGRREAEISDTQAEIAAGPT